MWRECQNILNRFNSINMMSICLIEFWLGSEIAMHMIRIWAGNKDKDMRESFQLFFRDIQMDKTSFGLHIGKIQRHKMDKWHSATTYQNLIESWEGKKLLKDIFCILCGCVLCAECCKILNIKGITNHCNWHYQFVDIILLWTRSHHPCKPMAHYIYLMFTRDNERKNIMKYFRILLSHKTYAFKMIYQEFSIWLDWSDLLSYYRSQ